MKITLCLVLILVLVWMMSCPKERFSGTGGNLKGANQQPTIHSSISFTNHTNDTVKITSISGLTLDTTFPIILNSNSIKEFPIYASTGPFSMVHGNDGGNQSIDIPYTLTYPTPLEPTGKNYEILFTWKEGPPVAGIVGLFSTPFNPNTNTKPDMACQGYPWPDYPNYC